MATFAIAHGAGDVAWSWHLVVAELEKRGHEVVAVDLPSEDDDATSPTTRTPSSRRSASATTWRWSATRSGAYTATLVADRLEAKLLVLVSGMVPRPGETASEWWSNTGYAELSQLDGDDTALFLHDVEPGLAAEALRRSRDQSGRPMEEPWPLDSWPDLETRYLALRDDRCFPAAWTREMARDRLGIEAEEMGGSHGVFLSRPGELADRLDGYLR